MDRKEAIEVIKKNWPDSSFTRLHEALETLIPELKESEDENIQEWIIGILKALDKDSRIHINLNPEMLPLAISWLEKQDEVKDSAISQHENKMCKENDDSLTREDERIRKALSAYFDKFKPNDMWDQVISFGDIVAWLRKQGEQKPTELSNTCEFSMKTWVNIVDFVLTEHNGIGNYLDDPEVKDTAQKLQKKYKFDAASEEWDRVYRKGLDAGVNKGRAEALREQKPAWSEEDEEMLNSFLHKLEVCDLLSNKENVWAVRKLKSLKDRYTWKPSEEQMRELKNVFDCSTLSWDEDILESLYKDLKKLMEG